MEKLFIKNRYSKNLSVLLEVSTPQKGLAFVMHGLGGFKEQLHVEVFAHSFLERGFSVVRFDTASTFGESEGSYENATITNYYEDLEDVIGWAKTQPWYQEPFALAGHSLGGICTALYAERNPKKILALAPISTVVSGKLSVETSNRLRPGEMEEWEKTGWREEQSNSKSGIIKRLPWSHIADRLKYDLLPEASKLIMPVLLIVGDEDDRTPPDHNQMFFDALPVPKEIHIIKNAPHTFRDPAQLKEIRSIFLRWIDSFSVTS